MEIIHENCPACDGELTDDYGTGAASQATYRAMFDHTPRIDTRTPADVAAQFHQPAR